MTLNKAFFLPLLGDFEDHGKQIIFTESKGKNMENLRFDLTICKETNDLQKEIRKALKEKGYKMKMIRTNRYIGAMHFNEVTEYFIKGNTLFEIEKDLENGVVSAMLHYGKDEHKHIRLGDVIELA